MLAMQILLNYVRLILCTFMHFDEKFIELLNLIKLNLAFFLINWTNQSNVRYHDYCMIIIKFGLQK